MTGWHASPEDLLSYRAGSATAPVAASLDTHLMRCAECRRALAAVTTTSAATGSSRRWEMVTAHLEADASQRSAGPVFRVGIASRPLVGALLAAVALLIAAPLVIASITGHSVELALLASAPLAPMVAVALTYRREIDPVGELALATPLAGFRIVTRRALLVAAVSVPIGVLCGMALGVSLGGALAWLLPGLALSALVLLAGTTRLDPAIVTACLGSGWAVAVWLASWRDGPDIVARAVGGAPAQLTCLLVAALALALFVGRGDRLTYRRFL